MNISKKHIHYKFRDRNKELYMVQFYYHIKALFYMKGAIIWRIKEKINREGY